MVGISQLMAAKLSGQKAAIEIDMPGLVPAAHKYVIQTNSL